MRSDGVIFSWKKKKGGESSQKFSFSLSRTNSFSLLLKKRAKSWKVKLLELFFYSLFLLSFLLRIVENAMQIGVNRSILFPFIVE